MELALLNKQLKKAKTPEDIFGILPGDGTAQEAAIKKSYRAMVKITYVDHQPDALKPLAEATFRLLNDKYEEALKRVENGIYGKKAETPKPPPSVSAPVEVKSKKGTYTVIKALATSDTNTLYLCNTKRKKAVLKVIRNPRDNDLMDNELRVLKAIKTDNKMAKYYPEALDSFTILDKKVRKNTTVFPYDPDFYSGDEVIAEYPMGVDALDFAWMFNRILEVMWNTHKAGYVHGAFLPPHVLFGQESHGLILTEWGYAVPIGQPLKAVSPQYEGWYPREVFKKEPAGPGIDIYMAAKTGIRLLGGDPVKEKVPAAIPVQITGFLRACILPSVNRRPNDAGALREEFGDLLKVLFGKRAFHPWKMPAHI